MATEKLNNILRAHIAEAGISTKDRLLAASFIVVNKDGTSKLLLLSPLRNWD